MAILMRIPLVFKLAEKYTGIFCATLTAESNLL